MKTIYKKLLFLMLLLPFGVFAQSTVEGIVVDKVSSQPIPGVNVVIQGAANGTQTDFDGKFKLSKVKKGDKIVFSYVGYKNSVITYDSQNNINIGLEEESNQLQEVLIQVGYGAAKKKDATGSVSLVTAKDFNKGAIVSVDQLLAGKAAGVRITNSGGSPDSSPNIRIRGGASLNASNNPLIIIDGVPIGDLNPAGVSNPFTLINPNDIESFSILKDASATAIYGVRASNGVILITTKKGTSGEPQFNYSANISVGKLNKSLNVMSGPEYTRFIQTYFPGTGVSSDKTNLLGVDDPSTTAIDNPATPEVEGRLLSNTDWEDQVMRTSISTDHNFTVRANMYKKIPFRVSLGYNKVQGLLKTNDYERFTYSFKMTPKLLQDNLKIDVNAKGSYTDKNAIDEGGALGGALSMDPTKPVYDASSIFGGYAQSLDPATNAPLGSWNPLALLEQRRRPERAVRFLGNVEFDYKLPFLKDLRAVVNLGIDASQARIRESFENNSIATYTLVPTGPVNQYIFNPGLTYLENQTSTNTTMDAYAVYNKTMTGFVTKFDAQAGYSYQNFKTDGNSEQTRIDGVTGLRIPNIDENNKNNRYYLPLNLQAFFARTNIDLLGKYLFTATMRADATSLYTPENRWGYFPAVGAAWKIKEESFLKNSNTVQDLKLRVGWGKTGQSGIAETDIGGGKKVGYFPSQLLFTPGNATSQYLPGVTIYSPISFSEDLTWEKTTTINFGLDFEFFKNSILSGSVDVYKRKTTDLLAVVTFPAGGTVSGDFAKNIGEIEGEGIETTLNVKAITTDKFSLSFGGNIAYNYNKVTNLEGRTVIAVTDTSVEGTGNYLMWHRVGEQPRSAWVFEQVYDGNGDAVVGAYVDRNGDGQITNDDRYYAATQPNWTYGFNTNVTYKNWDLSASFRGQIGGQVYNQKQKNQGALSSASSLNGNALYNVLESVNPLVEFGSLNNVPFSDMYMEDATFLRCDNISLAYKFLKFVKKSTLKVSGSVNNPFLFTNYSGQDPENFGAIDNNFYPRPTTYTLGLSLDF